MSRFLTAFQLLLMAGVSLLITACGQTGPLYHPGEKTPYGPPEYSIFHPHGPQTKNDKDKSTQPSTNSTAKSSNSTSN